MKGGGDEAGGSGPLEHLVLRGGTLTSGLPVVSLYEVDCSKIRRRRGANRATILPSCCLSMPYNLCLSWSM
jgi:hypothetical protein